MTPELEFVMKYAPGFGVFVAVILLISYIKKALFQDVVSKEHFALQIERERELVGAIKENAGHLQEISRQMESAAQTHAEEVRAQTETIRALMNDVCERLRTLELVFSDNIDAIRHLSLQCEKHRKNIPDTQDYRGKQHDPQ